MLASDRPDPHAGGHRHAGFTLVEVLAALVIVSLGMLGVIQAVSQTARSGAYLRERTIAHWIAMNRVTQVRLEPRQPTIGTSSDEVEMAGRKWRWSMEVTQTAVESIRRSDVSVALPESKDDSLAFVSGFYGTAEDRPGSTAKIWPGGDLSGSGNPNDPNNPNPNNPNGPSNPKNPKNPGNNQPSPLPGDPAPTDPGQPSGDQPQ